MSAFNLALRYLIIAVAFQLACAWVQTFQSPWPLVDAFELAPTANEQLFRSLGMHFSASIAISGYGRTASMRLFSHLFTPVKAEPQLAESAGSSHLFPSAGKSVPIKGCL